jgi:hypothetical protein
MTGLDAIIDHLNTHLGNTFCDRARSDFNGIADEVFKDGHLVPVCSVNGRGTPIMPDKTDRLKCFWRIAGDVRLDDVESYGLEEKKQLNVDLVLYAVTRREFLNGGCTGSIRGLVTELAESLPNQPFSLSADVDSVCIESVRFSTDSRSVLNTIYSGAQIEKWMLDNIAGAITFRVSARVCDMLCGDPLDVCPVVTVTDMGNTVELEAGESYTCTACPPTVAPFEYDFAFDSQDRQDWYWLEPPGSVDLDAVTLTNISAVVWTLNGVVVTGVNAIVQDDVLRAEITRTTPAVFSKIEGSVTLSGTAINISAYDYIWTDWENLNNMSILADVYSDHDALISGGAANVWDKSGTGKDKWTGAGRIEFLFRQNVFFGISTGAVTYPATQYQRMQHSIYCINGVLQAREFGVLKASSAGITKEGAIIAIEDTGAAVIYEYSDDNGATWTTFYTSAIVYVPSTLWYTDTVCRQPFTTISGIKVSSTNFV